MSNSYYVMHRQGVFTTSGAHNQCKSPDWNHFHYQLSMVFPGDHELDDLDQLTDHANIHAAVETAIPTGSCERMHKDIVEAVIEHCKSIDLPMLFCKCTIIPDPASQMAILSHVYVSDPVFLQLAPLAQYSVVPIPVEQVVAAQDRARRPFTPSADQPNPPTLNPAAAWPYPPQAATPSPVAPLSLKRGGEYLDRKGNRIAIVGKAKGNKPVDQTHPFLGQHVEAGRPWGQFSSDGKSWANGEFDLVAVAL